MDIECQHCGRDFLYFASGEFIRTKCKHLFHRDCLDYMGGSCAVCKQRLSVDHLETWRTVISRFSKDLKRCKKIFDMIKEHSLKSSDDEIRSSASRWYDARLSLINSILNSGDRFTRESIALMLKGAIAFEISPGKGEVNELVDELRKLLKKLYSHVNMILRSNANDEVRNALKSIFVNRNWVT